MDAPSVRPCTALAAPTRCASLGTARGQPTFALAAPLLDPADVDEPDPEPAVAPDPEDVDPESLDEDEAAPEDEPLPVSDLPAGIVELAVESALESVR